MKDLKVKDRVNEKLSKLVAAMKPAAVNLILAGAVALLVSIFILIISTTSKAEGVSFEGCDSDSVNLRDGLVTVEICWPDGGEDEASEYLDLAISALPQIEGFIGFSPVDSSLRIELGHDHTSTPWPYDTVEIPIEVAPRTLLHELTHTFQHSDISMSWFAEATSDITADVVLAQLGLVVSQLEIDG